MMKSTIPADKRFINLYHVRKCKLDHTELEMLGGINDIQINKLIDDQSASHSIDANQN